MRFVLFVALQFSAKSMVTSKPVNRFTKPHESVAHTGKSPGNPLEAHASLRRHGKSIAKAKCSEFFFV